jgi:autotransporter-associated beta strand protein
MKTPNPDNPIRNTLTHLALASAMGAALYFGAAPASAAPPVTADLKLHLDASQLGLSANDPVPTWTDVSGQGNHATTIEGIPYYKAAGIGGIPTVHFDAGDGLGNSLDYSAGSVTIFYVSRQTGGSNQRVFDSQSNNWLLGYWGGRRGSAYFEGDVLLGGNGASDTNPHLYATTIGGSGQNSTFWAEGVQIASNQNGTQGPKGISLGGGGAYNEFSDCEISEVLVYNRILDANELLAVGGYLTAKYGLTTTYPTGLTVRLTSPANNDAFVSGTPSISATATVVSGTAPYTVKFFTRSLPGGTFAQAGADLTTSPYTLDLGTLSNGSYEIKATVTDSATPTPATATSATNTFTVAPAIPTTTTVVSSGSPSIYGNSVTFTATVDPVPTGGTVQFYADAVALGTPVTVTAGVATYATTMLGVVGPNNITAEYSGYQIYEASTTAASISQVVTPAPLTVTAQNVFRFQNTPNPDPLPYQIAGFKNGQTLGTSGVSGEPILSTDAVLESLVGPYDIICDVTTLPGMSADNYSFTPVNGILTVVDPATPFGINVNLDSTVQPGLEGPAGGLGAVWNTTGASASNLRLASGPASTVGFTSSGTGGWIPFEADTEPTLRLLKRGYVNFTEPTTQQLVITGLDSAKTYDLSIASAILISSNQCSRGEWSTTNTTSTVGSQAVDNRLDENGSTWVRGNNYVLFEDVVPDGSGNITVNGFAITEQPTYDIRLALNGFQLVESATPAFRWKGADGGNWTDVANWNNPVPGAADIAILSDSDTAGQTLTLDADAAVAGLTFNNLVANQVIASPAGKTLTLATVPTLSANLTVEGTHSISAKVDISSGTKLGPGTVNLSGTVAAHQQAGSASNIAMFVSNGVLGISGTTTFDPGKRMRVDGSGTLEVTGVLNTAGPLFPVGSGDSTATATVILKGSGQWNQTHTTGGDVAIGISGANNGRLIIQDTAQLNTAFMVLGFFGPGAGTVQQNGGTVTLVTTPADYTALARPALWIGVSGPGDYHLNSGTLKCGTIGGSGKLYFNGGTLVANMDDLILVDPGASTAVGQTSFMQGLNQVVVQSGAVIDTAGHIITIAQNLEHDFSGPAIDGGLTKKGLGTLTLLQASCYTGPTKVQGGTLACATAASVAPTALEIDAAAKVDLTYTGNRNIPSLKIGVNVKDPGVYGSSSSPAPLANQDDVHFAGTGTVTVGGSTGFTSWAADNAPGQTPGKDHDNDGVENGVEYFMGQTGSSFTAMPGLDGTNKVTWTMDSCYFGTYEVQTSSDLVDWTNVDPRPLPSSGSLSYTLPADAPGGKSFVRLLVTPAP